MSTPRTENSTTRTDWTIDGSNKDFALTYVPATWSVMVFVNGVFQESTTSGSTVTLASAPVTSDYVVIHYVDYFGITSYATILGVVNLALIRIGVDQLSSMSVGTKVSLKVLAIWDYVRDVVLQARDWRFAKTRVALTVSATEPLYSYDYAYALPSDFLRLCRKRSDMRRASNPVYAPSALEYWFSSASGASVPTNYDPPIYPNIPYIIETLPADSSLYLLTNYDNTDNDLYINYIRRISDAGYYTPIFNSCLAYRLAAELAISLKESEAARDRMERAYEVELRKADAHNETLDSQENETGSDSWVDR